MFESPQPLRGIALFVHGYLDDSAAWGDVMQAMAANGIDNWQLMTIDLQELAVDNAHSDLLLEGFAAQVVERAIAVSDGLQLVLIGHSMGGPVVELAAQCLGRRVSGLVLVTPAPLKGSPLPEETMQRFESRLGMTDLEALRSGRIALSQSLTKNSLAVLVNSSLNTSKSKGLQQLRAWTGGHASGHSLSLIDAPVLVIATDDRFFTRAALQEAAHRFASSSVAYVQGAGHWAHLEKPHELADLIGDFLNQVEATG